MGEHTALRARLSDVIRQFKGSVTSIGVFSFFINLLMLTGPIYMLQVYDRVLISRSIPTLVALSILMMALYLFMGFLEFCRSRILTRLARKFEKDLGAETFRGWLKAGTYNQAQGFQPMIDLGTLKQFLSGNALGTIFDLPWVPFYVGVIFFLHWTLGVLGIIGCIIIVIAALYNEFATRKPTKESASLKRAEQSLVQQSYRNSDLVIALGMEDNISRKWEDINQRASDASMRNTDISGNSSAFTKAFRMMIQSAILGLGGALAVKQIVTPGAMIAASIIMGRALAPLQMAIGQWRSFGQARISFGRLKEFYALVPDSKDNIALPEPKGALTVANLYAAPPNIDRPILSGLNFNLEPGDGLGVIGPSGSGKSVLGRFLVGIWLPQSGDVRIDGVSHDQWRREEIGPKIGYLPQSVDLFDGTIAENISRFETGDNSEAIFKAAQMAGVHELILKFPDGYATRLGENGMILSGGQKQRIALARAIYGDPVLVVMDEPNSNLDAMGEQALSKAITALRKDKVTVILIAHRSGAISELNKLLMIHNGQQIAFGDKEDVLRKVVKPHS